MPAAGWYDVDTMADDIEQASRIGDFTRFLTRAI
jgi:hypothetical protein